MPRSRWVGTSPIWNRSRFASECSGTCRISTFRPRFRQATGSMPVGLGPIGLSGLYARRGEVQAARAAAAAGVPFSLSTLSACSIDEVAKGAPAGLLVPALHRQGPRIRVRHDRGGQGSRLRSDIADRRSRRSGLALPRISRRYIGRRIGGGSRRIAQVLSRPRWCWDVALRGRPMTLGNLEPLLGSGAALADLMGWVAANFDASVTWKDVEWVREQWDGPLIIKGILDPEDASAAAQRGRRDRRFQPRRPPARRGLLDRKSASGRRRSRRRTNPGAGRRRSALGPRRRPDARAGSRFRAAGARLGLCAGRRRAAGRRACAGADRAEMRVAMALTGTTKISDIGRRLWSGGEGAPCTTRHPSELAHFDHSPNGQRASWSGREDSNLRPLPPEDSALPG
jgi:L-lactate dehydrogenase (cytochrome)